MATNSEQYLVLAQLVNGNSLYEFTRRFYSQVIPDEYFDNWHIPAICEHLQACASGHITGLVINIPPRFMKSTLVSVMFPAWVWSYRPPTKFLYSSYSDGIAGRDGLQCLKLVRSRAYQQATGGQVQISAEAKSRMRFGNVAGGVRLAMSAEGAITGEGGDYVVVDDPHKAVDVNSAVKREKVIEWWDGAMSSRRNNPDYGAHIVVMQRLHENDLTGHILAKDPSTVHLFLPMEYDRKRHCTTPLFSDPRTRNGELLWTGRYTHKATRELKRKLGTQGYESQYQQNPKPRDGTLFKADWFRDAVIDEAELPQNLHWHRYYDLAYSLNPKADNTATVRGAMHDGVLYLADGVAGRMDSPTAKALIKRLMREEFDTLHGVEAAIHGVPMVQELLTDSNLAGIAIKSIPAIKDKLTRATPAAVRAEQHKIKFVKRLGSSNGWIAEWIDELVSFPFGAHDDRVDTVSGVLQMIGSGRSGVFL